MEANPNHHPLVQLARAAIEAYVCDGHVLRPDQAPAPVENQRAGVFVTIHTRSTGELRGCIGTIEPCEPDIARETIQNAISAATQDPRFPPIRTREMDDLEIDVSVLHPAEPITSIAELDPRQYGVIVRRGSRRGLLLPDIPGIDDAETQVTIARQKAWISPKDPVSLYRFKVDKYT
jgi:AmmeMemoRadiSam system protein A